MTWSITPLELCMIWELKDEKRYDMNDERYLKRYEKWWHVHNASGVVLKDNEIVEVVGTSCIMCVHASWGIPISHHEGRMRTSNGRTTIIMLCIARAMQSIMIVVLPLDVRIRPSWWDMGIPQDAWTHIMHEVPTTSTISLSFNTTPLALCTCHHFSYRFRYRSSFMSYRFSSFNSQIIHNSNGVILHVIYRNFMSFISCCIHTI